jgi:hypothetical protein
MTSLREVGRRALKQAKNEVELLGGKAALKSGDWLLNLIQRAFEAYYENANAEYFRKKSQPL